MKGHWQKAVPRKTGQYWTADRTGILDRVRVVAYDDQHVLCFAGSIVYKPGDGWGGWWWSDAIEEPPPAPKWDAK